MDLIQHLAKKGLIDEKKASSLEYEVQTSNRSPEEVILEKRALGEEELFKEKSEFIGIPFKKAYIGDISNEILEYIPRKTVEQYQMLPIGKEGDTLMIGMVYPRDKEALEVLKFLSRQKGFSYKRYLLTPSNYREILRRYKGLKQAVTRALEKLGGKEEEKKKKKKEKKMKPEEWKRLAEETPISKVVDVLLKHALEGEASDVHIEPFGDRLRVRFRVLGKLHSSIFLPFDYLPSIVARVKILSDLRIDESRIPQDGRFSEEIEGRKIDFRVSTFPTGKGEKVAIRILDPEKGLKSFSELGLLKRNYEIIKEAAKKISGMIIVSGPTGCGKTTTLYSVLQLLNREDVNIVTLEDPIEYFIEGINQSQVKPDIGYTFAHGLRYVLRQDPDIIMVGEIRDKESASLAIHAGLTGHLVLSTLHVTDVFGLIPRLARLGVEPYLLPVVLKAAVAQRLVRRLCDNCKKRFEVEGEMKNIILKELEEIPESQKEEIDFQKNPYLWKPEGCKECDEKGYSGRMGVFEVLEMTDELSEVIMRGEVEEEKIKAESEKQDMITMRQDAVLKAVKGITTLEEALRIRKT